MLNTYENVKNKSKTKSTARSRAPKTHHYGGTYSDMRLTRLAVRDTFLSRPFRVPPSPASPHTHPSTHRAPSRVPPPPPSSLLLLSHSLRLEQHPPEATKRGGGLAGWCSSPHTTRLPVLVGTLNQSTTSSQSTSPQGSARFATFSSQSPRRPRVRANQRHHTETLDLYTFQPITVRRPSVRNGRCAHIPPITNDRPPITAPG